MKPITDINEFRRAVDADQLALSQQVNPLLLDAESIVIYGAGYNGISALTFLRGAGIEPDCFCDANSELWDRELLGVPIKNMEHIQTMRKGSVIIISPTYTSVVIEAQLRALGFMNILFTACNAPTHFVLKGFAEGAAVRREIVEIEKHKIEMVRSALQDQKSKDVFQGCLELWQSGDYRATYGLGEDDEYFPQDIIRLGNNEVFVDCGAYTGDTIEMFVKQTAGKYEHIVAFEADPMNCERAKAYVRTKKFHNVSIFQIGVSDQKTSAALDARGLATVGSRIAAEGSAVIVPADSLDNLMQVRPTFIKMDIEGSEWAALKGARRIAEWGYPKLAICVYHVFEHLWEIPYHIITQYPQYKVYLRQHADLLETVCYAVK
jgi:FkbM family methyltransferase